MIYILRHQEGGEFTNCLSDVGIGHSYDIVDHIDKHKSIVVYTMLPQMNGKHVRPLQTASIVCSKLDMHLNIIDTDELPKDTHYQTDHIIIWHHSDMTEILTKYFPGANFEWDEDNFSGCLMINEHDRTWTFDPHFLTSDECFMQSFYFCCF